MAITWSDQDSESSDEEENSNLALTSVFSCLPLSVQVNENLVCLNNTISTDEGSHGDSDEFDLDEDSLKESYRNMYDQWLKVCSDNCLMANNNKVLKKRNEELDSLVKKYEIDIVAKDSEIKRLSNEVDQIVKDVKILNHRFMVLDDVLLAGQKACEFSRLGSNGSKPKRKAIYISGNLPIVSTTDPFAGTTQTHVASSSQSVTTHEKQTRNFENKKTGHFIPICNFCGVKGHIRTKCFTLMNFLQKKLL